VNDSYIILLTLACWFLIRWGLFIQFGYSFW